ncbi:tRNA N(3)-methylcytidine methyltransferase METTL6 [Anthonomus grandis grandis]|uniref:tRNA N(3)-methylcytidine methyltransferase METTL6 n=1 Tax=Anthonomus grandis grandis TaxID=2921223 RepID=UPI0021658066|nr:tRNA N(3)-methylcytidine methyltransferase METTL6 [Anthonomus grandis grandis]XP_050302592.1 tRNA N(3)-methylcytidine methyltransferase METTL6 [Anthonomus grandis grandis]
MSEDFQSDCTETKTLTPEESRALEYQNSRVVSDHKANLLEIQAKKHWDLFYKRNETRFFRDRHWTTREFSELLGDNGPQDEKVLFEIGCGVGNFIYPLLEENFNLKVVACDLSPRAVEFVKSNPSYTPERIKVFPCDITSNEVFDNVQADSLDIATLIFVLSAIHPNKFLACLQNIFKLLKPGGLLLFRDYGLFDMAQLRFKPGNKISENFYMRHDGTRTYFFSIDFVKQLFEEAGYIIHVNSYIHRRTVNKKDNIDVPRIFIQVKAQKPK